MKSAVELKKIIILKNMQGVIMVPQFRGPASCHSLITEKPGLHQ